MHALSHVKVPSETCRRRSADRGFLGMFRVQISRYVQEITVGAAAGSLGLWGCLL